MVGKVTKVTYLSDDGNNYAVPVPTWQIALAGGTAAAGGTGNPPKGFRARYRMLQDVATGREKKVKCHSTSSPFWLENMNTVHTNVNDGTVTGIPSAIAGGRIGERMLNR